MAKKKKGLTIDLSSVETGQKTLAEGIYTVKVESATAETSASGNPYIKFIFQVIEGKSRGAKVFHNCSLQPQALFNLKSLLLAIGYEIPQGAFDLDLEDLLDLECEIEVAHETYEGKKKVRIIEFIALESDEDDEEEEDEDDSEEDEDDEEEEEETEDDEDDEDDEDEDEEEDEEEDDEIDYSEMSLKELKEAAREAGIKVKKGMSREELIEALEEEEE